MSAEVLLQFDIFSGELVDTRSAAQKRRDREVLEPRQMEMFSQRDLAQYIPPARMSLPDTATLHLVMEDPRTEEEKESDRECAAKALTSPMFIIEDEAALLFGRETMTLTDEDDEGDVFEAPAEVLPAVTTTDSKDDLQAEALQELERVVSDIAQTVVAAPDVLRAQVIWLARATVDAQCSGVAPDVVSALLSRLEDARLQPLITHGTRNGHSSIAASLEASTHSEHLIGAHLTPSLV